MMRHSLTCHSWIADKRGWCLQANRQGRGNAGSRALVSPSLSRCARIARDVCNRVRPLRVLSSSAVAAAAVASATARVARRSSCSCRGAGPSCRGVAHEGRVGRQQRRLNQQWNMQHQGGLVHLCYRAAGHRLRGRTRLCYARKLIHL